jgi:hypothetical protein
LNDSFAVVSENNSIENLELVSGDKIDLERELSDLVSGDLKYIKSIDIDRTIAELNAIDPPTIDRRSFDLQQELARIELRNQAQAEEIERNVLQNKQIKFRTQQLAAHNKQQIEKAQQLLTAFEEVRRQILAGLSQFGSYEELKLTIEQMTAAQVKLIEVQQQLNSQEIQLYRSMQAIEQSTIATVTDSQQQLAQYHQDIVADRSQIAQLEHNLSLKTADIEKYHQEISTIHTLFSDKSTVIQARLTEIDRSFTELVESAQEDKLQFYELTAETIDKTQQMEFQFAKLSNQVSQNCENLSQLQTTVEVVRDMVDSGIATPSTTSEDRYQELLSDLEDLRDSKRAMAARVGKFSLWLWILSFALGTSLILGLATVIQLNSSSDSRTSSPSQQR